MLEKMKTSIIIVIGQSYKCSKNDYFTMFFNYQFFGRRSTQLIFFIEESDRNLTKRTTINMITKNRVNVFRPSHVLRIIATRIIHN